MQWRYRSEGSRESRRAPLSSPVVFVLQDCQVLLNKSDALQKMVFASRVPMTVTALKQYTVQASVGSLERVEMSWGWTARKSGG
eukprot:scaffold843_cov77-Skeletonema_dohrnii-CCMP3373.AAC.5